MINVIFFDLGKVLADFDWRAASEKIAGNSHRNSAEVYTLCTGGVLATAYETGKIETPLFFEKLKKELGFNGSEETLRTLWLDIFTPITEHIELLDKIRKKYPVGLISNTNEAHVEWIQKKFGFLEWFAQPTYSYQTGYLKPQKEIFYEALKALDARAEESLFIDDLEVNVLAAGQIGMKTIHLTRGVDLGDKLKEAGLSFLG